MNKIIEGIEEENRIKQEAAEKEQKRLANLNNTGIWSVGRYVDEFGNKTKKKFITNTDKIHGVFSNIATEDSKLDVDFLISSSSDIAIMLYEYAGNNPVKAISNTVYTILVDYGASSALKLYAINSSDRLCLNEESSVKLHKAILKGNVLRFRVYERDTPTTHYEFDINAPEYYENAYRKLMDK